MKPRLDQRPGDNVQLGDDGLATAPHLFSADEILAIDAALVTGRPLLVMGEPGTGKTQLARAAAKALDWALVHQTLDGLTEPRDLTWTVDAVSRLADAQLAATPGESTRDPRDLAHYVQPGALWWGLDWTTAEKQAERAGHGGCVCVARNAASTRGVVVLIDEIDKADRGVPNGLLDALDQQGGFNVDGVGRVDGQRRPLVVITSNGERELSHAFVRRCLVLRLAFETDPDTLIADLISRGEAHYPQASEEVLSKAAKVLVQDRQASAHEAARPGLAEYLDLVCAMKELWEDKPEERREEILKGLRRFFFPFAGYPGGCDRREEILKGLRRFTSQKHAASVSGE